MEQLLQAFGINGKLIIIQIINFTVLATALTYLLYKPVLKMLRDREAMIKKSIADAEEAAQARADAEAEKRDILGKASAEAETVAANAKQYAETKADEIVSEARKKADEVISEAHEKGEEMKIQAQKESEAQIAQIAILAAEKVLREKQS